MFFQRGEKLAGGPVEFLHRIAPSAVLGFAAKTLAGKRLARTAGHVVWQVEEEWLVLVGGDELQRGSGFALGHLVTISRRLDDLFIFHPRQWRPLVAAQSLADALAGGVGHIVAVWQTEVIIESLSRGQKLRLITQVPFANAGCRVACFFQNLGNGDFIGMQPVWRHRPEHVAVLGRPVQTHAARITASHERSAAGGADATGTVKTRQASPFPRHAIEVRRAMQLAAEGSNVAIAEIVGHDKNEIWLRRRHLGVGGKNREQK